VYKLEGGWQNVKISPKKFAQIVDYFSSGKLNNLGAKKVLDLALTTDKDIDEIIEKEGLAQVSLEEELERFIEEVIKDNPKPIKDYKEGKRGALQFLIGQVMRKTKGRANPKVVSSILERRLK